VSTLSSLLRRAVVPVLSVLTALILGGVVIVLTDFKNLSNIGTDPAGAILGAVGGVFKGYGAMLSGAFGDPAEVPMHVRQVVEGTVDHQRIA